MFLQWDEVDSGDILIIPMKSVRASVLVDGKLFVGVEVVPSDEPNSSIRRHLHMKLGDEPIHFQTDFEGTVLEAKEELTRVMHSKMLDLASSITDMFS